MKNDPLASGVSHMSPTLNLRMSIKITAIIDEDNMSYPLNMLGWENKIMNNQQIEKKQDCLGKEAILEIML